MTEHQEYYAFGRPGWSNHSGRRPGTVLAAAIITWIVAGLTLVFVVVLFAKTLIEQRDFYQEIAAQDSDWSETRSVVLTLGLTLAAWCAGALALAYFAFRRRNWARVGLVASSAVTSFVALPAVEVIVPIIWVGSSIAVIVLLFTGGANDWYRSAPSGGSGPTPRRPKDPPRELPRFY